MIEIEEQVDDQGNDTLLHLSVNKISYSILYSTYKYICIILEET